MEGHMDKTVKRCLLASATMHLFLIAVLLLGAAFFVQTDKPVPTDRVRFYPSRLIDAALAGGGGNPNIARTDDVQKGVERPVPPPVEKQPPVKPQVKAPTPPEKTEPVKPVIEKRATVPDKTKPKEVVKAKEPKSDKLELTPVVRSKETKKALEKARLDAEAKQAREAAKQWADANKKLAAALAKTAEHMQQGFESGTKVDVGGPGGEAYAGYASFVQAIYDNAWQLVRDLSDDNFITKVSVTISRDGTVTSARITKHSGNAAMDKSVQKALDKVKFVQPFPPGSTDSERTFIINFNLEAKRLIG
jgi:TonB family protein